MNDRPEPMKAWNVGWPVRFVRPDGSWGGGELVYAIQGLCVVRDDMRHEYYQGTAEQIDFVVPRSEWESDNEQ